MTWNDDRMTDRLAEILQDAAASSPDHHLGSPYMTPYQLAIALRDRAPEVQAHRPIGGQGAGQSGSLGQYIANELSKLIKRHGREFPIEGARLASEHVARVSFWTDNGEIDSTLPGSGYPFSMFRYREPQTPAP